MARFLLLNGLGYIEFENSLDESEYAATISSTEHEHSFTQVYQNVCKSPLVLAINGNPKSFYDSVILNTLNKIVVNDKLEENLVIDKKMFLNIDPISLVTDIGYDKPKKLAAFTHVFNEDKMLKLWIKYYGSLVGRENLYIIDHGSTVDIKSVVPSDINLISMPRGKCDHWNIAKYCAYFQRFLLTQYEWVIHTDCDEFLLVKEDNNFETILSKYKNLNIRGKYAYDILHDYENEPLLNYNSPILNQRKHMRECPNYLKCCLASQPATWAPGFHKSYEDLHDADELILLHLKYIEDKELYNRHETWKNVEQSVLDKTFCNISASKFHNCSSVDEIRTYLSIENSVDIPEWMKKYL